MRRSAVVLGMGSVAAACAACASGGQGAGLTAPGRAVAPLSLAADDAMIAIPAGRYVAGSTPEERAAAYDDYRLTSGATTAQDRGWFEREEPRHVATLPGFRIDLMPVTQTQYAEFVAAGKAPPPTIDAAGWRAQGYAQDFATQVARFTWQDGRPPTGREDHPVVLVTWREAAAYCAWRGELRGQPRRLPSAAEYEKAARGDHGLAYPWGNTFDAARLNSAVHGPRDTQPTAAAGASPYGVLDLAGNVFEWTSTELPEGQAMVKGSAWEDFGGMGRGASGHGRVTTARHVIIGFRCAADGA